jgi:hypothetical protein
LQRIRKLQNGKWYWDSSTLSLKDWMSLFDPMRERVDIQRLRIKLHSLPLELWLEHALTIIGNKIGRMLDIDERTKNLDKTFMAKIYLNNGFLMVSILRCSHGSFRCTICHLYGHVRRMCPKKGIPSEVIMAETRMEQEDKGYPRHVITPKYKGKEDTTRKSRGKSSDLEVV